MQTYDLGTDCGPYDRFSERSSLRLNGLLLTQTDVKPTSTFFCHDPVDENARAYVSRHVVVLVHLPGWRAPGGGWGPLAQRRHAARPPGTGPPARRTERRPPPASQQELDRQGTRQTMQSCEFGTSEPDSGHRSGRTACNLDDLDNLLMNKLCSDFPRPHFVTDVSVSTLPFPQSSTVTCNKPRCSLLSQQ